MDNYTLYDTIALHSWIFIFHHSSALIDLQKSYVAQSLILNMIQTTVKSLYANTNTGTIGDHSLHSGFTILECLWSLSITS